MELQKQNILCFGDSLTEGWYRFGSKFHPYTLRLAQLVNEEFGDKYEVINAGVSGECVIGGMTQRLPDLLRTIELLKLVIILGGTNDMASLWKHKSRELPNEIIKLHSMVHQLGVRTCALTLPEVDVGYQPITHIYNEYRQEVNKAIMDFANEHAKEVILCDMATDHPMLSLSDEDRKIYWDDNLHCTPAGYDKMGGIIFDHIKSYLSSNS